MANFWDDLNNQAAQRAQQGAPQSWDEYSRVMAAQQAAQPKKKKGFWQDQISTGGGIGGALAGGATGAAIGSAVPIVGTAIGGLLGAILGGAAGSGGGEMVENNMTGDDLWKNVGKEALFGGVTSVPFGAGLKLANAGSKAVTGGLVGVGKKTVGELVQEAGMSTIGKGTVAKLGATGKIGDAGTAAIERLGTAPTLKQIAGKKLNGAADDLAVKQFRLTPKQQNNYLTKFKEDAGQTIRKYGFTSVDDIAEKGVAPLNDQFGQLVTGIGSVPKATLQKNFDDAIAKLKAAAPSSTKAVGEQVETEAKNILAKAGDTIDANELNAIRREFDQLVNYTEKASNPALYKVNKRVADTIRTTLQKSDPTGQLKDVGREIQKLRQLSDNALQQDMLGRGSLPVGLIQTLSGVLGSAAGGPAGAIGTMATTSAINSAAGRRALMQTADKAAGSLTADIAPRAVGQTVAQAAARMGGIGAARSLAGDQSSDMSENTNMAMPSTTPMMNPTIVGSEYSEPAANTNPMGYSSAELGQALMQALAAGDNASVKQLNQMYELAAQYEQSQAGGDLSSTAATQVASNSNAMNTLQQLQDLYSGAGGGGGKIGGAFSNLMAGAGLDGNTQTYNDLSASSVSQLARALNGGGQVSDADAAVVIRALPKITDSPEVASKKFAALQARLQMALQNTMRYNAGGAPDPTTQAQSAY